MKASGINFSDLMIRTGDYPDTFEMPYRVGHTETSGVDLVAHYNVDWNAGNTLLSLAVNVNDTKVTRRTDRQSDPTNPDPVYFLSDGDVFRLSPRGTAGPTMSAQRCAVTGTATTRSPTIRRASSRI